MKHLKLYENFSENTLSYPLSSKEGDMIRDLGDALANEDDDEVNRIVKDMNLEYDSIYDIAAYISGGSIHVSGLREIK